MATLSEVVRRRRELESRSRTSALVGGVGEKLKEKFDPRQMLNQTGILATLFPSLKAFQARGRYDASDSRRASKATVVETQGVAMTKEVVVKLDKVIENTAVLPRIAKTMGTLLAITAQKSVEGKSAKQARDFFKSAKIKEGQYEGQFLKDDKSMQPTQVKAPEKSGGLLGGLLSLFGGLVKKILAFVVSNPAITGAILAFGGVAAALSTLKDGSIDLLETFKLMIAPIVGVVKGLMSIPAVISGFTEGFGNLIEGIKNFDFSLSNILGADRNKGKATGRTKAQMEGRAAGRPNPGSEADKLMQSSDRPKVGLRGKRGGRQEFGRATGGDAGHGGVTRRDRTARGSTSGPAKIGSTAIGEQSKSPTKSIPNRSVTGGKEGELLDFIASKESGGAGGYAAVYGQGANPDILNMTVAEVMQYQDELIAKGQKSSAMGRYQFIKSTLSEEAAAAGVDINKEVFSPHFQDALILHRLRRIRGLDKFMSGQMDKNQFGEELAKEFASMPQPSTGKSRYAGVAGNKALTTNEEVGNVLDNLRPENRSQNGAISGGKSSGASGTQQNTAKQGILERAMEAVSNVKDALFGGDGGATVINNNTNQNNVNNAGGGSKRPDTGDRNLENNLNPTSSYY